MQPISGSLYGGTVVTITGTGLPATESLKVSTSKYSLTVISKTTTQIVARTPDRKVKLLVAIFTIVLWHIVKDKLVDI